MKRKTLRGEITAFILVIISCITIAACAVSYRFIYHSMVANGMNYSRQLSEQLCSNIDFLFSSVEDGTDSLAQSPYMRYYGSHFLTVSVPGTSADKIKKTLWETSLANQNIDDLSLVYNGRKVSSLFNLYPQSVLTHVVQYYDRSDVLSQSRFVPLMYESRTGVRSLSCVRAIYSDSPSNDLCIVTSIRVDAILSLLQKVDLGENSGSCLTDAAGNIQYSTAVDDPFIAGMQKLLQAKKIADGQTFLDRIDGTEYLFSANAVGNSNLFAVIYIPLRTITRPITTLWQMILVVVGTLFSLSCLLTIWFSDRMTLPIRKLSKHMQEDSGRTLHVIEPSSDE
jgi:two-component system sensor histidine kinase YesM